MAKIKIHEIAKNTGLTSKEILEKANELGFNVKSHLSSVEEEQAKKIEESLKSGKSKNSNQVEKKENNKKDLKNEKKKESQPVIIRREVIVEEEHTEKNVKKPKETNEIGFIERNTNKNYNIVYRNKQQKPLTVNELFGIKNKNQEEKNEKNIQSDSKDVQKKLEDNTEDKKTVPNMEHIEEHKIEHNIIKEKTEKTENRSMNMTVKEENNQKSVNNRNNTKYNNENRYNNDNRNNNRYNNDRNNNSNRYNSDNSNNRNNNRYNNDNRNNNNRYSSDNVNQNNRYNNDNRNSNNNSNDNVNQNNRYNNNRYNSDNRDNNRYNNDNRNNNNRYNGNRYNNDNRDNNRYNNDNRSSNNNRYNNDNRSNNRYGNDRNNNRYGNQNGNRTLDERGIDKNIKDIMSTEIVEKEAQRDYASKSIDKVKQTKFEEAKASTKKTTKTRKQDKFSEFNEEKLKDLKQVDKLSHMFTEQDGGMLDYYDLTTERGKRNKRKSNRNEERIKQKIFKLTEITIPDSITVKDFATELKKTSGEVITKLMSLGIMATINNVLDFDTAYLVAEEFGVRAVRKNIVNDEDLLFDDSEDTEEDLVRRPPVVVVMGHVDHGKTSLLDAIRSTNVIEGEAGGITQHIGAYKVSVNGREITFLDTPGHEAFTSMRARGAQITDVAILVVAADDGVMPQTVEAINHAKAADIPIIVAVNKIDLPNANIDKIKQDLMKYDLVSEEWGGDTIFVPISAKKKLNIENLLEMVLLVADMKDLKANPNKQAKGVVIEARLDKAKGPVASVLVQRGTLNVGDTIVVGTSIGRIRAMKNDKGQSVKLAGPSTPVSLMGLTDLPEAGDTFYEVKNEKIAKHLIEKRRLQEREKSLNNNNAVTLNNLFEKMESENLKQLNLIVKSDVQGSAEAIKQSLEKLSDDEVKVKVIHSIAGAVNESDVQLAKAANAIIIAFNVRPVGMAKEIAEKEGVEIKQYSIIYNAIEDVKAAMMGMLDPIYEEKVIGNAIVRQTFKVSSVGTIAGCFVLDGKIERNAGVRVIREAVVIHEGKLVSLKRFKDDVKEVTKGYECGIQIENYNDLKENDTIEFFIMEEVKR